MQLDDEIGENVKRLKSCWKQCSTRQGRFRHYPFLEATYYLYADLKSRHAFMPAIEIFGQHLKRKRRQGAHPIRTLLDITCDADRKLKSRWVRALRYAWRRRQYWTSFRKFVRRNGGIAGCADWFTEDRNWRNSGKGHMPKPSLHTHGVIVQTVAKKRSVKSDCRGSSETSRRVEFVKGAHHA